MSGFLFTNSMLMLERAMDFQWTKQNVINDNIVNAETPNYKAKYVTFEEALDSSIRSALHRTDRRMYDALCYQPLSAGGPCGGG